MKIRPIKTRLFKKGENLSEFIALRLKRIPDGAILVLASKIVALSEGPFVQRSNVEQKSKERLIRKESAWAVESQGVWLTEKDGMLMANAGIDESNADGGLVLLPKNSFESARLLRLALKKRFKLKRLGVIISDSALMPLRAGVVGAAVGYAGFKGIRDYRGKKDLSRRTLKMSRTNVADSLATAAALVMGEGAERQPLAIITDAPVEFTEKANKKELRIRAKEDIFWPLLKKLKRTKNT